MVGRLEYVVIYSKALGYVTTGPARARLPVGFCTCLALARDAKMLTKTPIGPARGLHHQNLQTQRNLADPYADTSVSVLHPPWFGRVGTR